MRGCCSAAPWLRPRRRRSADINYKNNQRPAEQTRLLWEKGGDVIRSELPAVCFYGDVAGDSSHRRVWWVSAAPQHLLQVQTVVLLGPPANQPQVSKEEISDHFRTFRRRSLRL